MIRQVMKGFINELVKQAEIEPVMDYTKYLKARKKITKVSKEKKRVGRPMVYKNE